MVAVMSALSRELFSKRETRLVIEGPEYPIEVIVNGVTDGEPKAVALVAHPHPLFGGTMDNKVAFTAARACRDSGVAALRFNFRGVGKSEGLHDDGIGEAQDLRWLLDQLQGLFPHLPLISLGFSFGAGMSAKIAQTRALDGLVLIAPPVPRYGMKQAEQFAMPLLVLMADDDELVIADGVYQWFDKIEQPQKQLARWSEAGHFFHGKLPELGQAIGEFIRALVAKS